MTNKRPLIDAWSIASEHFDNAQEGVAGRLPLPSELSRKIDFSIPNDPCDEEALFRDMKSYLEYTTNTLTPNFANQLFSGLNPYALAGDWLSSLTNTTMATFEVSPMATLMERSLIKHLSSKAGWANGDGIMVTGGSNANMIGMLLARNVKFPETKSEGLTSEKLVVFVSEESHYSFEKAGNMMGLGTKNIRKIPSHDDGTMNLKELKTAIGNSLNAGEKPFLIAATAGTTVLGAFDPIEEISFLAEQYKLWLHVDGAWGGSVLLSEKHKHLMKGIERADSLAWDTHKMLGTGLISSFFLTKHQHALRASHDGGGANYIFHESDSSSYDSGPYSLQCGRRNEAFKVWLAWRSMGDKGASRFVEKLFDNARVAAELIKGSPDLELLQYPTMLNVCFRFKSESNQNEINKKIRRVLLNKGDHFINLSTRRGETFFRLITVHPELNREILEKMFKSIIQIGRGL